MSHRSFARLTILTLLAMLAALIPFQVRAGGVCGGAYTVESGDTVDKLAAMCGTSASAIYAANPGLKEPLTAGLTITIPGINFGAPTTAVVVVTVVAPSITPTPVPANNYNTYNYYNYYNYYPSSTYTGTYTVQYGDTFSNIAYRFGVTIYDLWAANPYIWDINLLYVGQTLYIPASSWTGGTSSVSAEEPTELSYYGDVPKNAPRGSVTLINKANADVYISLRTTRGDGTTAINEYPVSGTSYADIPIGWIDYVAWVGGVKYTGGFKLGGDSTHSITFYKNRVAVDE